MDSLINPLISHHRYLTQVVIKQSLSLYVIFWFFISLCSLVRGGTLHEPSKVPVTTIGALGHFETG